MELKLNWQSLLLPGLLTLMLLSGCSVINFGIGAAMDPPGKRVHENQFEVFQYPFHYQNAIRSVKVFSDKGIREVRHCECLFIKENQREKLWPVSVGEFTVNTKGGSNHTDNSLTHVGRDTMGLFLRLRHHSTGEVTTVFEHEIESMTFQPMRVDSMRNIDNSYLILMATDSTQKTLKSSDIEDFYLGFDVSGRYIDPYYVRVKEIDKIEIRTRMGMLPYMLAGIGLAVDAIAGALMLLL